MPRVTVIIPTYNWSSVLPYAIGSVLRQTFSDFELLVIGDGCTDGSESVVARITDPRVRWINLPVNTGHQSGPNNEGLRQARGEWIAYLGHDDLWLPRHLELLTAAIEKGAELAYSITEMVPPGGAAPAFEPMELEPYLPGMWMPPTSVVHHRAAALAVGGWRHFREVSRDPEADLWLRIHAAGGRIACVRRMTVVKFPALQRRDAYKLRLCHEQAAWSARIEAEPDFEATELARLLKSEFPELRPLRPFREVLAEFRDDFVARLRRRLVRARLLRVNPLAGRDKLMKSRRRFKGLK